MDSTVSKKALSKPHPLEPWRDIPCKCIHCGKILRNSAAKNVHLQHCTKRILSRYFKVGTYLFIVQWNPLKRRSAALHNLIVKFHDPKMFIAVLEYNKEIGVLHNYSATKLDGSPEMLEYPDGVIRYPVIVQKLSKMGLDGFHQEVQKLEAEKIKVLGTPTNVGEYEKSV